MKAALKFLIFLAVLWAGWKLVGHVNFRSWLPGGDGPRLTVVSIECISEGLPRAEIEVRNTGDAPVESPTGVVRFGTSQTTGHFVPTTIQPDANASLIVYADNTTGDCELVSVADKDGRVTEFANRPNVVHPRDRMQVLP